MPHYLFSERKGVQVVDLGGMVLVDDAAALAFARNVVDDLIRQNAADQTSFLDIASDDRLVGSIPFASRPSSPRT
jgi:hypothetical protein